MAANARAALGHFGILGGTHNAVHYDMLLCRDCGITLAVVWLSQIARNSLV